MFCIKNVVFINQSWFIRQWLVTKSLVWSASIPRILRNFYSVKWDQFAGSWISRKDDIVLLNRAIILKLSFIYLTFYTFIFYCYNKCESFGGWIIVTQSRQSNSRFILWNLSIKYIKVRNVVKSEHLFLV